jgi:hypothetical protein
LIDLLDASDDVIMKWIEENLDLPRKLDDFSACEAEYQNLLDFLVES